MATEFPILHSKGGRGHIPDSVPRVRIDKSKTYLLFNRAALAYFGITDYIRLGYDRETQIVVIQLLTEWQDGARKLNRVSGRKNVQISAKLFFDYFGLEPKTGLHAELIQIGNTLQFSWPSSGPLRP